MAIKILKNARMRTAELLTIGLLLGVVDQISGDTVLIEYKTAAGVLSHTSVSMSQSACIPKEGQTVHFFKDYKIVKCEDIQ